MATNEDSSHYGHDYTAVIAIIVTVAIAYALFHLLLCFLAVRQKQEAAAARQQQPPAPAVEMAHAGAGAEPAPLVCTYRSADGCRDATCGVCLAELADGDAVRVLPACMHYFHAACVDEWLRARATCPLCRAALAPAGATA